MYVRYIDKMSMYGLSSDSKVRLIASSVQNVQDIYVSLWQWIRGDFVSQFGAHGVDVKNLRGGVQ